MLVLLWPIATIILHPVPMLAWGALSLMCNSSTTNEESSAVSFMWQVNGRHGIVWWTVSWHVLFTLCNFGPIASAQFNRKMLTRRTWNWMGIVSNADKESLAVLKIWQKSAMSGITTSVIWSWTIVTMWINQHGNECQNHNFSNHSLLLCWIWNNNWSQFFDCVRILFSTSTMITKSYLSYL